jgi:hypothetical protein
VQLTPCGELKLKPGAVSAEIERFYPAAVPLIARGADVLSDREKRPALIDW